MSDKIIVLSDGETWDSLDHVKILEVSDEGFEDLQSGYDPRHLKDRSKNVLSEKSLVDLLSRPKKIFRVLRVYFETGNVIQENFFFDESEAQSFLEDCLTKSQNHKIVGCRFQIDSIPIK